MKSWPHLYLPPIDAKFFFPDLSLLDTASGCSVELPRKERYRMYVCGITPYDATHLGHAATYLSFDLVTRYLLASGKEVSYVQNVTDVDDPLLLRAKRDGLDWQVLAQSQIELFRGDMSDLHVIPPSDFIGAVETIPLVIEAIIELDKSDAVYEIEGDRYFRLKKDPEFGQRTHLSTEKMIEISAQRGGDPQRIGKEDPLDPLVWLAAREGEPRWESSLGAGRPGWHIECSAIALHYLEPESNDDYLIDIQGGGSDLAFPHHEMGAAQARVLAGKKYSRIYMHTGMIGLDGEKMSKSLGNLVFLSALINAGADPMAVRIALLNRNYSEDFMWSQSGLDTAQAFIDNLRLLLSRPEVAPTDGVIQEIIAALSDNLNTVQIFVKIEEWCRKTESGLRGGSAGELARALDLLLGIAI